VPLNLSGATRTRTGLRVQSAPGMSGSVLSLQTCPGQRRPMRPLEEAVLEPGGIPGDAHFSPQSTRQVLVVDAETLQALGLEPGTVKENVTLAGVGATALAPGTRLAVGDAELELTGECRPCGRMEEIRPGLQGELEGRRGMYARVVRGGRVRAGDPVRVVGSADSGPAEPRGPAGGAGP
jgi:hypothetical protein